MGLIISSALIAAAWYALVRAQERLIMLICAAGGLAILILVAHDIIRFWL